MLSRIGRVQTEDRTINQLQSNILSALNQVISNPVLNGIVLSQVSLVTGSNTISHKLGRRLVGWVPVRVRADATFYDTQDDNALPEKTLLLTSSADVTVDLFVF